MASAAKIPPIRRILVDFDGTMAPFTWPMKIEAPYHGVRDALLRLRGMGYELVIFTSRAWPGWIEVAGRQFYKDQLNQMKAWLAKWEIPYDSITHEKMPCVWMIDDRSLNPTGVSGFWETLPALVDMGGDDYGNKGVGKEFKIERADDAKR